MGYDLNRREFIKLLAAVPLIKFTKDSTASAVVNRSPQESRSPNILILIFDALSAENVSLYCYPRNTTPNLSKFAETATVFHRHYAGGNFTTPGTASLLTGVYPWSHRAFQPFGTVMPEFEEKNLFHGHRNGSAHTTAYTHNDLVSILLYQFRDDINLLKKTAELCLFDEFFSTEIFPNDHNAAYIGERVISRGLLGEDPRLPSSLYFSSLHRIWRNRFAKTYNTAYKKSYPRGLPSTNKLNRYFLLEDAVDWVKGHFADVPQPFIGYFHFLPPHRPYNPHRDFIDMFTDDWQPKSKPYHFFSRGISEKELKKKRRNYDEYVAYADAEFGRLVNFLNSKGLLKNTLLVVTSDHGEMFERGILYHSTETLFEPVIRIPLVISRPGQESRVDVHTPTSCVDLLPTLLHVSGQPVPYWCEGEILPTFSSTAPNTDRSLFIVEAKYNPKFGPLTKGTVALVKGRYKLISYFGYEVYRDQYEMYDLINDPEELEDLYTETNSTADDMKAELSVKVKQVDEPFRRN